jgi:hypothetical protein
MWIGALQVINQKTSQPTTLGFGHVSFFSFFFNTGSNWLLVSAPTGVRMPLLIQVSASSHATASMYWPIRWVKSNASSFDLTWLS